MPELAKSLSAHRHDACIATAIATAEQLCRKLGLRFTPLRRQVLEYVWQSHRPIGAYEILERLGAQGRRAAPPTVYRALDFLIEAGLVHRLDSLNAFIGCPNPAQSHSGQFLICRDCRAVIEFEDPQISDLALNRASALGFSAVEQMLEIHGLCRACRHS